MSKGIFHSELSNRTIAKVGVTMVGVPMVGIAIIGIAMVGVSTAGAPVVSTAAARIAPLENPGNWDSARAVADVLRRFSFHCPNHCPNHCQPLGPCFSPLLGQGLSTRIAPSCHHVAPGGTSDVWPDLAPDVS